jgi:MFS family permease
MWSNLPREEAEGQVHQARQRFVAAFSVLRVRDMRRVWGSQVLSEVGDWAARFALAVLVYDRSGSPFLTAATLAVTYLPYLLSPIITPIAQRYSLRRMMIGSDLLRMVLFALIALPLPTWSLLALAFVAGLATPPFEAARTAIIPEAAGEDRMADGYALSNVTFQTAQAFGLATGGALLFLIGPEAALILNAATFGVSAVLLFRIEAGRQPPPPEPPVTRTRHAFTLMTRRGLLRQMLVFFLLLALADAAISGLLPVFLRSADVNPILMAGLIATAPLVGAFSGTIVPREGSPTHLLRISCAVTVLAASPAAVLFALANNGSATMVVVLTLAAVLAYGVTIAADTPTMTGSMMIVPDHLRAPFVSIVQPGLMGVQAVGALAAGALASIIPTTSTMALALIVPVAYSSWALLRTLPPAEIDLRAMTEPPANTDVRRSDAEPIT